MTCQFSLGLPTETIFVTQTRRTSTHFVQPIEETLEGLLDIAAEAEALAEAVKEEL